MKLAARALLPALLAAGGLWVTGVYEMQSTPANILLLLCCYLLGFGILLYAGRLKIGKTPWFYLYYAGLAVFSGLLAVSFLKQPLAALYGSFILLPIAMFVLPAVFEVVQERLKNVQSG